MKNEQQIQESFQNKIENVEEDIKTYTYALMRELQYITQDLDIGSASKELCANKVAQLNRAIITRQTLINTAASIGINA